MARVLITGGCGLLGRCLRAHLTGGELAYTSFRTPPEPGSPGAAMALDLRDRAAVARTFADWRPDCVIHTAAPRGAERLGEIAVVTAHVAAAAAEVGARLVHVSTDMVFDGKRPPYSEGDRPAPLQPYGEAKWAAERAATARLDDAVIVRTSLIYGFEPADHQTAWLIEAVERGTPVSLFVDEFRCPVWVDDLAAALVELIGSSHRGPLHVAGSQRLSRWEFGRRILAHLGLEAGDSIGPGRLAESGLERPPDLTLDLSRAGSVLSRLPRGVDEVLAALRAAAGGTAAAPGEVGRDADSEADDEVDRA